MYRQIGIDCQDRSVAHPARVGETLFVAGELCNRPLEIRSGVVRAVNHSCEGHRQIMAFYLPGDVIGLPLAGEHRYTAEAASPVLCVRHPRTRHGNIGFSIRGDMNDFLSNIWQEEARFITRGLILGRVGMLARMSAFLMSIVPALQKSGGLLELPMSQNDIASYLGASAETVSRTLRQMREMRVIAMPQRRRLAILASEALESLAEGADPDDV